MGLSLPLLSPAIGRALDIQQCLSADGHVYVIVSTSTAAIGAQVTSLALTQGAPSVCVEQSGANGGVVTALAAGTGTPLTNVVRTTVLSGFPRNRIDCGRDFDPDGAGGNGVLHLPGPAGRTVSADLEFSSEALVPVGEADALVPAAAQVRRIRRRFSTLGRCGGSTMTFPLGGDGVTNSHWGRGEEPNQAVTLDETIGTKVGNDMWPDVQETPDGFLLQGDCSSYSSCQIAVFIAELGTDGCRHGASAAAAGFSVSGDLQTVATEAAVATSAPPACGGDVGN